MSKRKRKDAEPSLFPDPSPEEIRQERNQKKAATEKRLKEVGEDYRARVKAIVGKIEFQSLDSRRLNLPRAAKFHAEFWRARYEDCVKRSLDVEEIE